MDDTYSNLFMLSIIVQNIFLNLCCRSGYSQELIQEMSTEEGHVLSPPPPKCDVFYIRQNHPRWPRQQTSLLLDVYR
jgi:hypothetical protein